MEVLALKPGADFQPREVRVYRPYRDEIPWELLSGPDDRVPDFPEDSFMRVAKFADEVVGVYVIRPQGGPLVFRLETLVVTAAFRRRGVGRWLLGHAIGLAESKGGRELAVDAGPARGFFLAAGFETQGADLRLAFTPE